MNEIPEGMKALRDALGDLLMARGYVHWMHGKWAAAALLAPDGPLWPALRALGIMARTNSFGWLMTSDQQVERLGDYGITGPLADACLAAAEAQP